MIHKHTSGKRFMALLLTLSMMFSLVPGMAFAEGGTAETVKPKPLAIDPASGTAVAAGYKVNLTAMDQYATVYYVCNDENATTPEYIKEHGTSGGAQMGMAVLEIKEPTTVKAVVEMKDGTLGDINTATYTIREPLTDGTYTVPLTCPTYMMDSFIYNYPQGKPTGMMDKNAKVVIKGEEMTVTIPVKVYNKDNFKSLKYRLESTPEFADMTLTDKNEDGTPDEVSFTTTHTELPLIVNAQYATEKFPDGHTFGLSLDFAKAKKEGEPKPKPEPGTDSENPGDYEQIATVKVEMNGDQFTAADGNQYKPSEIIKSPAMTPGTMVMGGTTLSMFGASMDELPLLKKGDKYYVRMRWNKVISGCAYSPKHFQQVAVDFSDLNAKQTETPVESKLVTDNGVEYWDTYLCVGTQDKMNDRQFYWVEYEYEMSGQVGAMGDKFSMRILPEYTITNEQNEKMLADGEYLASYTLVNEGHIVNQSDRFDLVNPDQKIPVSIKNGKATIRLESTDILKASYGIYGKESSKNILPAVMIPRENDKKCYIYVETDDLRKVIGLADNTPNEFAQFKKAIKIDMSSMQENPNPPDIYEGYDILEDGTYLADIQILDAQGNALNMPMAKKSLKVKAQHGQIAVTVPFDQNANLSDFTWKIFGRKITHKSYVPVDKKKSTVDINLFHKNDAAHYSAKVDGVEKDFYVKLVPGSIRTESSGCGLEDGFYTVNIQTLKENSDDISMSGDYIEKKNVAVRVENGHMYMTLDVKTSNAELGMKDLIKGFKHELNAKWVEDTYEVTDPSKYDDGLDRITTEIEIANLTDPTFVSIYVTAMGSWPILRIVPDMDTLEENKDVTLEPKLHVDTNAVALLPEGEQTVKANITGGSGYTMSWSSDKESVATVDQNGKITAEKAGTATVTVKATKDGANELTQRIAVTVKEGTAVKVETPTVADKTVSATISGDALVTNSQPADKVENKRNRVIVDAQSTNASAKQAAEAEITLQKTAAAALADGQKDVEIKTNLGTVTLDAKLLNQVKAANKDVKLVIGKAAKPNGLAGTF